MPAGQPGIDRGSPPQVLSGSQHPRCVTHTTSSTPQGYAVPGPVGTWTAAPQPAQRSQKSKRNGFTMSRVTYFGPRG